MTVQRNEIAIIHSYYDSSGVSQYQQVTTEITELHKINILLSCWGEPIAVDKWNHFTVALWNNSGFITQTRHNATEWSRTKLNKNMPMHKLDPHDEY